MIAAVWGVTDDTVEGEASGVGQLGIGPLVIVPVEFLLAVNFLREILTFPLWQGLL